MPHPVADRALVAQGQSGDMRQRIRLGNAPTALADDHGDLALIVQLRTFRRADQGCPMAGEAAGEPGEQGHVRGRVLAVLVLGVAVGKVDADADDLFGVGHGDVEGIGPDRMRHPPRRRRDPQQRPRSDHTAQGGPLRKAGGEIGETFWRDQPPGLPPCDPHRRQPFQHRLPFLSGRWFHAPSGRDDRLCLQPAFGQCRAVKHRPQFEP